MKTDEKTLAYNRDWYQENKDTILQQKRKYYQENKEAKKATAKQWRENNPDKVKLQHVRGKHKRRLAESSVINDLTKEDVRFLELFQNNKCVSCGTDITGNYHIDHIHPVSKGGGLTLGNVQLLCESCNCSKKDKTIDYIGYYLFTGSYVNG